MSNKLKEKVLEIASIAKECPENLQEKCFELLLQDYLEDRNGSNNEDKQRVTAREKDKLKDNQEENGNDKGNQQDFQKKDLHVKLRKFLQDNTLDESYINELFYKEDSKIKPLYDDLGTTVIIENQIRIALLQALIKSINKGNFEFDGEEVRNECQVRKCYDPANFAANFKQSAELFENFSAYKKSDPVIRLGSQGRSKLVEVIKHLSKQ